MGTILVAILMLGCLILVFTLILCNFRQMCYENSFFQAVSKLLFAGVCGATAAEILCFLDIPIGSVTYDDNTEMLLICTGAAGAILSKAISMGLRRMSGMRIIDIREVEACPPPTQTQTQTGKQEDFDVVTCYTPAPEVARPSQTPSI